MMTKPDRLSESEFPGPLKKLARKLNELRDYTFSITLQPGLGFRLKRTSIGTIAEVEPIPATTSTDSLPTWLP